ncbi:MAG: GNAT family N-acetyltransferase [Flavobacteriaceae bacterium]|jgi:GNAT superfamily N-acetyltransferase|nr:GNAT family N-acetyltransferase [Flavobacteriaceae bacterium]
MEFIEVKEEHYPVILQIAHKTWPVAFKDILSTQQINYMLEMMYSIKSIKNQIYNLHHKYVLVKDKKHGFLGYISYEVDYKPLVTKIHKIYVLPEAQGRGIGKILIEKAEFFAGEKGNITLSLNVNRFNKAIQFYERMGFRICGSEDIDIGNGFLMEDYIMNKDFM